MGDISTADYEREQKKRREAIIAAGHEDTQHAWHMERRRADRLTEQVARLKASLSLCVRGDGSRDNPVKHEIHFTSQEMAQIRAAYFGD